MIPTSLSGNLNQKTRCNLSASHPLAQLDVMLRASHPLVQLRLPNIQYECFRPILLSESPVLCYADIYRHVMRFNLTHTGVNSLMVPRTMVLAFFLPADCCVSDERAVVVHMTQVYSAHCQTWSAVRLVYWLSVLSGLL